MADNGLFVERGCDPADLFGSEVAQFEHGRVRSIYGGAAYRYLHSWCGLGSTYNIDASKPQIIRL